LHKYPSTSEKGNDGHGCKKSCQYNLHFTQTTVKPKDVTLNVIRRFLILTRQK